MAKAERSRRQSRDPASGSSLFLSYNSADQAALVLIRRELEAAGVSSFFDREDLKPGAPWFPELERTLSRASAVAVFLGPHGLGEWQHREVQLALVRQANEQRGGRNFAVVPVLLPKADLEQAGGFLFLNTWIDLRGGSGDRGQIRKLAGVAAGQSYPISPDESLPVCPYLALNAFREQDSHIYFGRETTSNTLLRKVLRTPFTMVIGPSGSGKSSLVQAGLLPRLRVQRPPAPMWLPLVMRPGREPFQRLAAALVSCLEKHKSPTEMLILSGELGRKMLDGTVSVAAAMDSAVQASAGTDRLLLVVDQFEELFTHDGNSRDFLERLLASLDQSAVSIVGTMRADFYSQAIAASRKLSELIEEGVVNVHSFSADEIRDVIEKPAMRGGFSFEGGLLARILGDVAAQPGSLPLLEFALTELWERRSGSILTHAAYDELGRIAGSVARRAETQFETIPATRRDRVMPVFGRLVNVADKPGEAADTRRRVALDEFAADRDIIDRFTSARLLVISRGEASVRDVVEIAHEAIIRGWKRLADYVDEQREFLAWRRRLASQLQEWLDHDRSDPYLLRGASAAGAEKWLQDRGAELSESEVVFIESSALLAPLDEAITREFGGAFTSDPSKRAEAMHQLLDMALEFKRPHDVERLAGQLADSLGGLEEYPEEQLKTLTKALFFLGTGDEVLELLSVRDAGMLPPAAPQAERASGAEKAIAFLRQIPADQRMKRLAEGALGQLCQEKRYQEALAIIESAGLPVPFEIGSVVRAAADGGEVQLAIRILELIQPGHPSRASAAERVAVAAFRRNLADVGARFAREASSYSFSEIAAVAVESGAAEILVRDLLPDLKSWESGSRCGHILQALVKNGKTDVLVRLWPVVHLDVDPTPVLELMIGRGLIDTVVTLLSQMRGTPGRWGYDAVTCWMHVAELIAAADLTAAHQLLGRVPAGPPYDGVLAGIIRYLLAQGNSRQARELLPPKLDIKTLEVLVRHTDLLPADEVLRSIQSLDQYSDARIRFAMADVLIDRGDLREAMEVLTPVRSPSFYGPNTFDTLAGKFAENLDWDSALLITHQGTVGETTLASITTRMVAAGEWQRLRDLLQQERIGFSLPNLLPRVIAQADLAGELEIAAELRAWAKAQGISLVQTSERIHEAGSSGG